MSYGIYWYCRETNLQTVNSYEIPDWCPLPNASQPGIEADAEKYIHCPNCGEHVPCDLFGSCAERTA